VDFAEGARKARGEVGYRRILGVFQKEGALWAAALRKDFPPAGPRELLAVFRDMESSAGIVGASGLAESAAALQEAARNGDAVLLDEGRYRCLAVLRNVLIRVDDYLDGKVSADLSAPVATPTASPAGPPPVPRSAASVRTETSASPAEPSSGTPSGIDRQTGGLVAGAFDGAPAIGGGTAVTGDGSADVGGGAGVPGDGTAYVGGVAAVAGDGTAGAGGVSAEPGVRTAGAGGVAAVPGGGTAGRSSGLESGDKTALEGEASRPPLAPRPAPELPPEIESMAEIDFETGVERCRGQKDRFKRLLSFYLTDLDGWFRMVEDGRAKGEMDMKDATIKFHAMKSASATVGAMRLSEEAAGLEAAGRREDSAFIMERLEKCSLILEGVRYRIERYIGDSA
jgi:HPt (histidine-containing phosphotransfer) domain-containing protein